MADVLGFLEIMVTSWPLAVVVIVLVLRRPLSDILGSLRTGWGKAGGSEVHLGLQRLATKVRDLTAPAAPVAPPLQGSGEPRAEPASGKEPSSTTTGSVLAAYEFADRVFSMRSSDPKTLISWAWEQVEAWIAAAAAPPVDLPLVDLPGSSNARPHRTAAQLDRLLRAHDIDQATYDVLNELWHVRNRAVHSRDAVTLVDALAYTSIARGMIQLLAESAQRTMGAH